MKMKRRALSLLLSLAVMVTFMPMMTLSVSAASKGGKTYIVTKAKADDGNTTYKYNKKGLVAKAVKKTSSKGESYDTNTKVTTTYKYNKKNRIAKETTKKVVTDTFYDTDKTTGKNNGVKTGSVTTTTTDVTKYTYKKGVAKKAVTTSTTVKSGSKTTSRKYRSLSDYIHEYDEDYGYSKVYRNDKELADNKGIIAGYNDQKADGSYYEKNGPENAYYYTGAVNDANVEVTETTTYTNNGDGTYKENVETTTTLKDVDAKYVYTYYMRNESGAYVECTREQAWESDDSFYIIKEVQLVPGEGGSTTKTDKLEMTHRDVDVTNTTYANKKKQVKKAVSTTVATDETVFGEHSTSRNTTYSDGKTYKYNYTDKSIDKMTDVSTTAETTTYAYKKGKAKKMTVSDPGVANSASTYETGVPNYVAEATYRDGTSEKTTVSSSGAEFDNVEKVTKANGVQTTETIYNNYTKTITDNDGTRTVEVKDRKNTSETKALKATPSKYVGTYKYDKKGNVKSAKMTGNKSEVVTMKNAVFGNDLYEFDANGEAVKAETVVNHTIKYATKNENTLKKGSKRLSKMLSLLTTKKYDRATSSGYGFSGRTVYKLKAKKVSKKLSKAVEAQQWILQNGELNGIVGL